MSDKLETAQEAAIEAEVEVGEALEGWVGSEGVACPVEPELQREAVIGLSHEDPFLQTTTRTTLGLISCSLCGICRPEQGSGGMTQAERSWQRVSGCGNIAVLHTLRTLRELRMLGRTDPDC